MQQIHNEKKMDFNMRLLLLLSLLASTLLLSSCASTVATVKVDQTLQVSATDGYVLIGIDSNSSLDRIDIRGKKSIRLAQQDLRPGSNYLLFQLPAGDYYFSYVSLGYQRGFVLDDPDLWGIQVQPSRINYVGDLSFQTRGVFGNRAAIELFNRAASAYQFLSERFPQVLASHQLAYGGPGEDFFLPFMQQQLQATEGR